MTKPEMILFDYGQTLIDEQYNAVNGSRAVMKYAVKNRHGLTPEQVQEAAEKLISEVRRDENHTRKSFMIEVPNSMFNAYLYASLGIELSITGADIDRVFWEGAAPGIPTEGVEEMLDFLHENGIRTGVISNISYDPQVVRERINNRLPGNHFEFIIPSSEYLFRKPHRKIFDLALDMAGLAPEKVWYVGDTLEFDAAGAQNAGIFPVRYIGALKKAVRTEDVLTIENWSELVAIIENMLQ